MSNTLRIEPIQQPQIDDEFSLIDETGEEIAVVTGEAWAKKFAVVEGLIEIALQFIAECAECNHTGLVSVHIPGHDTVAEWDADEQPCPECTPARALLAQAGVVV
jgi:hypothetical protein